MKLSSLPVLTAATLSSASLQFTNPNYNNITVGQPFNLTWTGATGPVTITLIKGATPAFATTVATIASKVTESSYIWTPASSLLRDVYDIVFEDGTGVPVHSFQFELLGGLIMATTSTSSATSSATMPSYTATFMYPIIGSS